MNLMKKAKKSNLKISFLLPFLFIVLISACKQENDIDLTIIDDLAGVYEGDYNHEGGWVLYSPTITKLTDSTVLINYWPSGADSITMKIRGNNLEIEKQIFDLEAHSLGEGHFYFYELRLSASGSFKNNNIQMTFEEEIKIEGESEFIHDDSGTIYIIKQ